MQSLRTTYKQFQNEAYEKKPLFPTTAKTQKIIKQVDE
jgi:hypothetical protein